MYVVKLHPFDQKIRLEFFPQKLFSFHKRITNLSGSLFFTENKGPPGLLSTTNLYFVQIILRIIFEHLIAEVHGNSHKHIYEFNNLNRS